MKKIIVSGSLAYDRIMNFSDIFSNHILPDKLHDLNVCFQVDGVIEHYGGTAGNIAYSLKLMGENSLITATIGKDNHSYLEWLAKNNLLTDGIKIINEELTAGAYITTDTKNNQITGFNPGAMKHSSQLDFSILDPQGTLLHISPGNLEDMISYALKAKEIGMDYIFDPGQALPVLQGNDLISAIDGAMMLIVNDYEFNLILNKTELEQDKLLTLPETTIITLGGEGSVVYADGKQTKIPVIKAARVVDPTGAGDSFRGGLLSGLVNGKSLREAAIMGSVCGSFAVEHNGTQVYSFSREEFNERLATA